jgi:hypothetical protein
MTETKYLDGKVLKRSLPLFQGAPPADAHGPKRLVLPQGDLANFYDDDAGIRYAAFIEMRSGGVRGNHWHRVKEEQVYVISGELLLVAQDGETGPRVSVRLAAGDLAIIACGVAHAIKTVEPGQAIEFSQTRFDAADVQRFTLI